MGFTLSNWLSVNEDKPDSDDEASNRLLNHGSGCMARVLGLFG